MALRDDLDAGPLGLDQGLRPAAQMSGQELVCPAHIKADLSQPASWLAVASSQDDAHDIQRCMCT